MTDGIMAIFAAIGLGVTVLVVWLTACVVIVKIGKHWRIEG